MGLFIEGVLSKYYGTGFHTGGSIIAKGVHFKRADGATQPMTVGLDGAVTKENFEYILEECKFENVNVEFTGSTEMIIFKKNELIDSTLYLYSAETKSNTILNNFGNDGSIIDIDKGTGNLVSGNRVGEIIVYDKKNQVIGNTSKKIGVYYDSNEIQKNTSDSIEITGTLNTVKFNRFKNMIISGSENQIIQNTISDFKGGSDLSDGAILLNGADKNQISNNIIRSNEANGILLKNGADENIISQNMIEENTGSGISIGRYGTEEQKSYGAKNIIKENTIRNNGRQGILIVNSPSNRIEKNKILSNKKDGLMIDTVYNPLYTVHTDSTENDVLSNKIKGSEDSGIYIRGQKSAKNRFHLNIIEASGWAGARVDGTENVIHNNIFKKNVRPVIDSGTSNVWNQAKTPGKNIVGGLFLGGNYWDSYNGADADHDRLGDTAYPILNADNQPVAQDALPLMVPNVNSTGDAADKDIEDGFCDTGNTIIRNGKPEPECTLRAAIQEANASPGQDQIFFDIPIVGVPTIILQNSLPTITDVLSIDGSTQPNSGIVKIDGKSNSVKGNGLELNANGVVEITGLQITGFGDSGIKVQGNTILNLLLSDIIANSGSGIFSQSQQPMFIADSTISGNSGNGITVDAGGIASGSFNVQITGNKGSGINVTGDFPISLSDAIISGNDLDGIDTIGPAMISHASIYNNAGNGIYSHGIQTLGEIDVNNSVIYKNRKNGILAKKTATVRQTAIHNNDMSGINIVEEVVEGNLYGEDIIANLNGVNGIEIAGDAIVNRGQACRNGQNNVLIGGFNGLNAFIYNAACLLVDFSGKPLIGTTPLKVQFTDLSTGNIASWAWNFGDGQTGSDQHPEHTYQQPGTYTVSLTITTIAGATGSTFKPFYIQAISVNLSQIIAILQILAGLPVDLNNLPPDMNSDGKIGFEDALILFHEMMTPAP